MFGILLLHSFGSTPKEFDNLITYLKDQGFYTSAPLLPGHGTTPKDLDGINYKEWVFAAENAFNDLNSYCQGVYVVGQTLGAVLALNLASCQPGILGLITLSGFLRLSKWQRLIRPIFPFLPDMIPFASEKSKFITQFLDQWIATGTYYNIPKSSFLEVNNILGETNRLLKKIEQPIYILHSTQTVGIDDSNATMILRKVSSKKKQLLFINKGGALMTMGEGKAIVFREISNFLWSCIELYQM